MSKIANRYAKGLLDFVQESGDVSLVYSEMQNIVKIIKECKELKSFYQTPHVTSKKKMEVSLEVFGKFSDTVKKFISLVISHSRESMLLDIANAFINKVDIANNVKKVLLTTATNLSQNQIDKILASSKLAMDSKYEVKIKINPNIIGGYILRVGDYQYDESVRSKLNQIKKNFSYNLK